MPNIDPSLQRFNTLIPQLETGRLNDELTEAIQRCTSEISDACADRGVKHKASLTLTLTFTMDAKDKLVEIEAALTEKLPKAPRGRAGIYFLDAHNKLTKENPRQMQMFDEVAERRRERADIA